MGFLTKFEGRMEDTVEGAADRLAKTPLSPVQIAKKAEKQMRREKMVGAGKQYAPTLYTVLVSPEDDERLFAYYPTLAGETETYLAAKAIEEGYVMDGQPLVRFIVDEGLRHGKFDVVAEMVASPLVAQLRDEEMQRYGIASPQASRYQAGRGMQPGLQAGMQAPPQQNAYQQQGFQPAYQQPAYQQPPAPSYDPAPAPYAPTYEAAAAPSTFAPFGEEDEPLYDEQSYAPGFYQDPEEILFAPLSFEPGQQAAQPQAPQPMDGRRSQPVIPQPAFSPQPYGEQYDQRAGDPFAAMPSLQQHASLYDLSTGRTYELNQGRTLLGRESSNDIVVSDINASRFHAEINQQGGSWVISDAGSMNGTFVNGIQIKSQALHPGDRVRLGTSEFTFQLS